MTLSLLWPVISVCATTQATRSIAAFRYARRDPKGVFGVVLWDVGIETRKRCLGWCCGSIERRGVLTLWLDGLLAGRLRRPRLWRGRWRDYNRPNSRARATASVRRWTCSLPKIFLLCPFTVSRARTSRSLIS